ncbi:MAG: ETC complex I subunit [Alphaproteobacteria bacterium]
MNVKIYKPTKNAMQSGRAGLNDWVLEYNTTSSRQAEPLMGWTSSKDTLNQVRLKFDTCDDAVAFAEGKGWDYDVTPESVRRVKPKNYTDNFKYIPPEDAKKA